MNKNITSLMIMSECKRRLLDALEQIDTVTVMIGQVDQTVVHPTNVSAMQDVLRYVRERIRKATIDPVCYQISTISRDVELLDEMST